MIHVEVKINNSVARGPLMCVEHLIATLSSVHKLVHQVIANRQRPSASVDTVHNPYSVTFLIRTFRFECIVVCCDSKNEYKKTCDYKGLGRVFKMC